MSFAAQDLAFFGESKGSDSDSDAALAAELAAQFQAEDAKQQALLEADELAAKQLAGHAEPKRRTRTDEDEEFAKQLFLQEQAAEQKASSQSARASSQSAKAMPRAAPVPQDTCAGCLNPLRGRLSFTSSSIVSALDQHFHSACFKCALCLAPFTSTTFQVATIDDQSVAVHADCHRELFHPKCKVCTGPVPSLYSRHPFFPDWAYCGRHEDVARRCSGCNRIESAGGFAELGDSDRVLCMSCCRTAVLDTAEMKPLWTAVLDFLDQDLKICVWPDMASIPVLSVSYPTLNENSKASVHASGGSLTRGLCLTEVQRKGISVPSFQYDSRRGGYVATHQHIDLGNSSANVTAILCLSGLPKDLTLSILAHESVHAWLKLHPSFAAMPHEFDKQSEEGVCQLVAHLYLQELERGRRGNSGGEGGGGDSDDLLDSDLRKFFKFSVETDQSRVYGEGFRKAAALYAVLGLEPILNALIETGTLPQ